MDSPKVIALRAGVVFALLALMPLLVLPCVVAQIDALFYPVDAALLPAPRTQPTAPRGSDEVLLAQRARQSVAKPATAVSASPARSHATSDVNRRIQQAKVRLQDLGASYMLLEAAGDQERVFHFHCRMPVGESQAYFLPFDATGDDPAATMEQVVLAVEEWRNPVREVQTAERPRQWQ
jgi:hypothetical protein